MNYYQFKQEAIFSTTIMFFNVLLSKMEANYQTLGLKLKKKILTSFDIKNDDILNDSAHIQKALFS